MSGDRSSRNFLEPLVAANADDLASHQSRWVNQSAPPIAATKWEIPPNGGAWRGDRLALLEGQLPASCTATSFISPPNPGQKLAFADAQRYIADPGKLMR
jgi:hypothetical protein